MNLLVQRRLVAVLGILAAGVVLLGGQGATAQPSHDTYDGWCCLARGQNGGAAWAWGASEFEARQRCIDEAFRHNLRNPQIVVSVRSWR
jgi:hypothetical protein